MPEPAITPQPCGHLIQTYTDDAFLARVVVGYVAEGLRQGAGAVLVATPEHTNDFIEGLTTSGVDILAAFGARQVLCLDAVRTLGRIVIDGMPDRAAFFSVVTAALGQVRDAGFSSIRVYGEMVDLLWRQSLEATLRLEGFWNEALTDPCLSLLCGYRIDPLDRPRQGLLRQVTQCHTRLLPDEDQERLEHAVDRAYAEVFGSDADVDLLRELLLTSDHVLPPMPKAHATMLALADLPGRIPIDVSERARAYYRKRD
jgi:hypothetical protein